MEITVNGIDKVLDDALNDYKLGKIQFKNVIFVGDEGIGRSSRIKKWLENHSDEVSSFYFPPTVVRKIKMENGEVKYGFADSDMEGLTRNGTICICKRLNYYTREQIQPYNEIFTDRTYCIPTTNKKYDLHKLVLVVATAYPDDLGYNVADISGLKNCSDVYTVTPSVAEFKDYFNETVSSLNKKDKIENFNRILSSPYFGFVLEKGEIFSPCNFMMLFSYCKTGLEEEVLSEITSIGTAGKKTVEMFKKVFRG